MDADSVWTYFKILRNKFDAYFRQYFGYILSLLTLCQTIDLLGAILNNRPTNVTLIFPRRPVLQRVIQFLF
ncbi:hypothetical protein DMX02_26115 [Pseudomonas jessenii]|nr:hypothetical protein DMX02_26115 [Pseudomonas jessenii]